MDKDDLRLRYARQMAVTEIGREGQIKLCGSKVLVVGCGALGSMVAMQLAGAGVGRLGLADYDTVDISNLQRQFFFNTDDSGKSKVELIAQRVKDLNPGTSVTVYKELITAAKAEKIIGDYDFIVDATDNPDSKNIIGKIAQQKNKACCIGGVRNFSGQIITLLPDDARFEEYFGSASADGFMPCSLGGVMGPAAALCASIQASETIKYLTGAGKLISGSLLTFNLLNNSFRIFQL